MSIESELNEVLLVAARFGLPCPSRTAHPDAATFDQALMVAQMDHLAGLVGSAVAAGAIRLDDDLLRERLTAQWHEELLGCVQLEVLVVRVAALLDRGGVRWLLTKGPAIAHTDYPIPEMRTFGDIDIIVHPEDWTSAVEVLQSHDFHRDSAPLPGNYDQYLGKGATYSTDGLEVDLHRRFAVGRFGVTSRMEDLFLADESITLGGRRVPVPSGSDRLLHACFHAALGGFGRLRAFRDVAQLLLVTEVDWRTTFDTARRWKSEAVLASAISETWTRLELENDHEALDHARSIRIGLLDRHALAVFREERSFRTQAMTAVPRLRPRNLVRLAKAGIGARRSTTAPSDGCT